ncbi:MAG: class I SAM-dependent methyltransferase [Eubacteriales bacterium]|nr:class I SAM-dependent methyltransferase [Eubacteriales bacterium]
MRSDYAWSGENMEQKQLQLQPRLQLLADMVPAGSRLADIGTDHGYLPVWLLQQGKIPFAIASDIHSEPLTHARQSAQEYGADGIHFRLCSGLDAIAPQEVDTIVIAGMGGETIIHILESAPWTKTGRYTILLQPMTKVELLRDWLVDNGYRFVKERLVRDKDFLYPVMQMTAGSQPKLTPLQRCVGAALSDDPLYSEYLSQHIGRLQRAIDGMNRSNGDSNRQKAEEMMALLQEMEQERRRWQ